MTGQRSAASEVRECLLAMLHDTSPRPWLTVDLQDAFSGVHRLRVYNALRQLEERGRVLRFVSHTTLGIWWTAADPGPFCAPHGRPAVRVANVGGSGNAAIGGYVCDWGTQCSGLVLMDAWPVAWRNDRALAALEALGLSS